MTRKSKPMMVMAVIVERDYENLNHLPGVANPQSLLRASADPGTEGEIAKYTKLSAAGVPTQTSYKSESNLLPVVPPCLIRVCRIVRKRIQTALALEDASDCDVSFKDQLADLTTGAHYIFGTTKTPHSHYGDDWDLLWFGHCSTQQHSSDERRFVIENAGSVPATAHRANFNAVPKLTGVGYDNNSCIISRVNDAVCLCSYALSYRGAQKVPRWQNSVKEEDDRGSVGRRAAAHDAPSHKIRLETLS
ncbi:MAG: hypothetical protein Q9181_000202 [Wetmoreana brouardii]